MATAMVDNRTDQLCTFRLGNLYLGIDVLDVREVLQTAEITGVPHAHEAVEGLINLRGQIATAINLRRRLGVDALVTDGVSESGGEDHHDLDDSADDAMSFGNSISLDDLGSHSESEETETAPSEDATDYEVQSSELEDRSRLPLHVVIMSDEEPVTLMVDAIGDVVDVDRSTYEVPPPTLTGPARRFIRGAYKMDGELLLLLDLPRLVTLEVATEAVED